VKYNWDLGWNLINQESSGGTLAESYVVRNPMAEVSMLLGMVSGSNPSTGAYAYFAYDHLGSVRAVYDANKTATGDYDYTPYGSIYAQAGARALTDLPAAFTGKPLDPATGLYCFPYRIYSPDLARSLSRDPLGMVDGPNVYGYVVHKGGVFDFDPVTCDIGDQIAEPYAPNTARKDLCQDGAWQAHQMYLFYVQTVKAYVSQVESWLRTVSISPTARSDIRRFIRKVQTAMLKPPYNPYERLRKTYEWCEEHGPATFNDGYWYYLELVSFADLMYASTGLIGHVSKALLQIGIPHIP